MLKRFHFLIQGSFLVSTVLVLFLLCTTSIQAQTVEVPNPGRQIIVGVQIPDSTPVTQADRLSAAPFKFGWIKYQYALGSDQPIEQWIRDARQDGYRVMVSVAKNEGSNRIPTLGAPSIWSNQYCPWPEELERRPIWGTDATGATVQIGEEVEPEPWGNGYMEFREKMRALVPRLGPDVEAYEIWNEPNTLLEWTDQGLGPISPFNYARFLECGIKGAKRDTALRPTYISAALAPLSGDYDDERFFNEFIAAGGLSEPHAPNAIGWHSNVTQNIAPTDPNMAGFQRVRLAFGKGLPIWITEFGWNRRSSGIDQSEQNGYVTEAYRVGASFPDVAAMFVWNFGFGKLLGESHDFFYWDIEGTTVGTKCFVGTTQFQPKVSTTYVAEPNLRDDAESIKTFNHTLLPESVNAKIKEELDLEKARIKEIKVDVRSGFFANIANIFRSLIPCFRIFGVTVGYCTPIISLGLGEASSITTNTVTGHNTSELSKTAIALGQSYQPTSIVLQPRLMDCNFLDIVSPGTDFVDDYSERMGTGAGFWGEHRAELEDMERLIKARMPVNNIYIEQKFFPGDERSPDGNIRQCVWDETAFPSKVFHPDGICQ